MPNTVLVGESFSPWTKKARWALEYCGLTYQYKEYTPTLSEPGLRLRLKQFSGSVSVPILFAGKNVLRGSWEIAGFANEIAGNNRLGDMDKISFWNDLSENALAEGRTRVVRSILKNDVALEEALPSFIPRLLRPQMRFIARDAAQRLDRKYAHLVKPDSLKKALETIREGLAKSSSDYILGQFSYADITMSVILEVIDPIAQHEPPLGRETRKLWRDPELSNNYADLVEWRNRLAADPVTSFSQFRFSE